MATNRQNLKTRYVVCVSNGGYSASLERRKIYQAIPDPQGAAHNMVRVVDESGEDYLYPADYFVPITLSRTVVKRAFVIAA